MRDAGKVISQQQDDYTALRDGVQELESFMDDLDWSGPTKAPAGSMFDVYERVQALFGKESEIVLIDEAESVPEEIWETKLAREYIIEGTTTGRIENTSPNFTNIPRELTK